MFQDWLCSDGFRISDPSSINLDIDDIYKVFHFHFHNCTSFRECKLVEVHGMKEALIC